MSEGTWEKFSQVAVKGAEHDSRERRPHSKCLEGTRVVLLNHIYESLANKENNRLIWLHGTAGVGKSAVAFTVAEKMRGLKMTEDTKVETRLGGTFFFSRKHTKRRTTGYFFTTLAYQLAINFPSVQPDVNRAILKDPSLLDPDKSLRKQMEGLFLQPLRKLQSRLRECPPLTFVIDALDECTHESLDEYSSESRDEDEDESELTELISLLAQVLRDPDLPSIHILVTSRSEAHICEVMQNEDVRPLLCEIPVKIFGKGVAGTISLDGADVDEDIYRFLKHSFGKLHRRSPAFPQPTKDQVKKLAIRAGRRFIVASTMMKFIDNQHDDPRDRLHLMLDLTNELLPGTEVYELYDRILSTCADPKRAYLHLSIVAALTDPLPISQISELLGPGQGRDVEKVLVQLRSVIDVPPDSTLPVNIYHSSVRDYVSHRSNCSLYTTSPHSLLARSSLRLMMRELPGPSDLLHALLVLNRQSHVMERHEPRNLTHSLSFIVQPEPMQVLVTLLWLRGNRSKLQFWLSTLDGCAWLESLDGHAWLDTRDGRAWLRTQEGNDWLYTHMLQTCPDTLDQTQCELVSAPIQSMRVVPQTQRELASAPIQFMRVLPQREQTSLLLRRRNDWLQTQGGKDWVQSHVGEDWVQTQGAQDWLRIQGGKDWLQTKGGRLWVQTYGSPYWLQTEGGLQWLQTLGGQDWLQTPVGQDWLRTERGQDWLQSHDGKDWLQTRGGNDWLQTPSARNWLQTSDGRNWLQTPQGQICWLTTAWMAMEEFSNTVEAIKQHIVPELTFNPAFQAIEQFRSLPDFLMFPAFLALRHQDHSSSASTQSRLLPNMNIIHAMKAFSHFANEARERSRSPSNVLNYACENWAVHISRVPNPWDEKLVHIFKSFCDRHLLSWLERQWCAKGLQSCLNILSEGEKTIKEHLLRTPGSSQ